MRPVRRWRGACGCLCALLMLSGCRRERASTSSYVDALPAPEDPLVMEGEVGRYGGRFVVSGEAPPTTFNPVTGVTLGTNEIAAQLFVRLTRFDAGTQEERPALARSWEFSDQGKTWTFHLRKDARFSDGHPITAEDVVFSFAAVYDPKVQSTAKATVSTNGKPWDISAPDPSTVVIRTPTPIGALPVLTSGVGILPRHLLEPALKSGTFTSSYGLATPAAELVSSGPWRLKTFSPGEKTVLTRNLHWFGVDREGHRLPYLDELVFTVVPDQNAADLKFRTREVDAIPRAVAQNYRWYQDHQRDGDFTLHDLGPSLSTQYLWFNLTRVRKAAAGKAVGTPSAGETKFAWFNSSVFRRAVSIAIDRDSMIKSIYYGDAVKNWSSTTAADRRWSTPGVVHDDYDPVEARRLLASLGMADRDADGVLEDSSGHPVAFSLKTNSNSPARIGMATFLRDDLAKVGIAITVIPMDFNALITAYDVDFDYDAVMIGSGFNRPDPSQAANTWRSSGNGHRWNPRQPRPETPEEARVDRLLDAVLAAGEASTRKALWKELQDYVNQQAWLIWLPTEVQKMPVRNGFGNIAPTAALSGANGVLWNAPQIFVELKR